MKTILLTISLGLFAYVAQAQAVFNVKSPSNIAGNYDFTWADPAGGWGTPDFNVQGTFIEDTAMLVDDGSTGLNAQGNPISAEGCNPLINDLTGKIAVIYRNTCEFGAKALNAQNAGAVGVIIVNRESDVIAMGPGADGANVTIPVAFVSNSTGALIVTAMQSGSVVVFMGNKVGFFGNDLGMNKADIFIPNPNTNNSAIAQNDTEYSVRVGAFINNFGLNDQTNANFNAVITYNGNELYNQSQTFDLLSLENTSIELPIFSQTTYPVGKYTITYTITGSNTDEYSSDNTYTADFFISDNIFSYANVDANGLPVASSSLRPSGTAGTTFTSCIHFRNANASRTNAKGLYFAATTSDQLFDGRLVEVYAYKWNNVFTDVNDSLNSNFDNYEQVGFANYNYVGDSLNLQTVYAQFDTPVTLLDNQRYLFCITTYDADVYLGYGNLDYSLVYANELQPLFPIMWDQFYLAGFGADSPPSIGVVLAENAMFYVSALPNNQNGGTVVGSGSYANASNVTLTATANAGYNFVNWTENGTEIGTATTLSFSVTSDRNIIANFASNSSSVEENKIANVNVYPNPSKDKIKLSGSDLAKFTSIELKDQLGRTIGSWKMNLNDATIDVSKFANGNYLLVLNGTNGSVVKNVQVNH